MCNKVEGSPCGECGMTMRYPTGECVMCKNKSLQPSGYRAKMANLRKETGMSARERKEYADFCASRGTM